MKLCIKAANAALPADASDNKLILFVVAELEGENWINLTSNMNREDRREAIETYIKSLKHRDTFGPDNNN